MVTTFRSEAVINGVTDLDAIFGHDTKNGRRGRFLEVAILQGFVEKGNSELTRRRRSRAGGLLASHPAWNVVVRRSAIGQEPQLNDTYFYRIMVFTFSHRLKAKELAVSRGGRVLLQLAPGEHAKCGQVFTENSTDSLVAR